MSEKLKIGFDEDGNELRAGDKVIVNSEFIETVEEIDGETAIDEPPNGEIVQSVELLERK